MFSAASIFPTVVPQTTPTRPDGMSEAPRQVCVQLRRHNQAPKARFAFCAAPYTNSSGHFVTISWTRAPGIACPRAFLEPFARRRSRVSSRHLGRMCRPSPVSPVRAWATRRAQACTQPGPEISLFNASVAH